MTERKRCLLMTVESDSHIWNLVYLQLFLEERGYQVDNLGCCTKVAYALRRIAETSPAFVLVSSVNGHGYVQGMRLYAEAESRFGSEIPEFVIGGKLTTHLSDIPRIKRNLLDIGYTAVFVDGDMIAELDSFLLARNSSLDELKFMIG
ncbi:MAG: hypothetical protein Tsb002_04210 [Wenzhouxiangellaceae bacterium]